jgi:hypothetical protein
LHKRYLSSLHAPPFSCFDREKIKEPQTPLLVFVALISSDIGTIVIIHFLLSNVAYNGYRKKEVHLFCFLLQVQHLLT